MQALRNAGYLATGLALVLTAAACGGDGGSKDSVLTRLRSTTSAAASQQPSAAPARPAYDFAGVPGPAAVLRGWGDRIGLQVKSIDTAFVAQLGDLPAEPGQHLLAALVAIKPELDDRGVQDVDLKDLHLRFTVTGGTCNGREFPVEGKLRCAYDAYFGSQLMEPEDVPGGSGEWQNSAVWHNEMVSMTALETGEEAVGVVGFPIEDTIRLTDAELCGGFIIDDTATCLPVTVPERSS